MYGLRQVSLSLAVGLVVVFALAACGDDGGVVKPESPTPAETVSAESPTPAETVSAESPTPARPGGTLTIALGSLGTENLDPILGVSQSALYLELVYDWIFGANADGTDLSEDTGLAESWTSSPDGLTWTLQIREGVNFQGGAGEATSADVKFSLERTMSERSQ